MKTITLLILVMGFSNPTFAHEGHDKTPGVVTAPHGGVVQGSDNLYWELVKESADLKLYPLTHDLAPIPLKEISLTGTATLPKKKKGDAVKFSPMSDHFITQVDAKGAYRYSLDLSFTYKGKKEKVKFQVEPQS